MGTCLGNIYCDMYNILAQRDYYFSSEIWIRFCQILILVTSTVNGKAPLLAYHIKTPIWRLVCFQGSHCDFTFNIFTDHWFLKIYLSKWEWQTLLWKVFWNKMDTNNRMQTVSWCWHEYLLGLYSLSGKTSYRNIQSRGFETSWDLTVRRLTA